MRSIQLQFYLLVVCGAAESFKETSVDLGQNVTVHCEIFVRDVYWFLTKPSEPPVFILRTYKAQIHTPEYSNATINKTFSVRQNSSLFIQNISTNELGVYQCIQVTTGSTPNIGTGIRLYASNHSAENRRRNQTADEACLWRAIAIGSGTAACVVIVSLAALIRSGCGRSAKFQLQPSDCEEEQRAGSHNDGTFTTVEFTQLPVA